MTDFAVRALPLLLALLSFASGSVGHAQRAKPTFRIMMIADGESPVLSVRQARLKAEILALAKEDARVFFPEPKVKPNWTLESAEAALKAARADKSVDMIIVSGAMMGVAVG